MMKPHENKMLPREAVSNKSQRFIVQDIKEWILQEDAAYLKAKGKRKAKRKMKKLA